MVWRCRAGPTWTTLGVMSSAASGVRYRQFVETGGGSSTDDYAIQSSSERHRRTIPANSVTAHTVLRLVGRSTAVPERIILAGAAGGESRLGDAWHRDSAPAPSSRGCLRSRRLLRTSSPRTDGAAPRRGRARGV